ncbi:MAG: phosphoribosyltransferase family protein [Patescibacteria group bacterium]
MTGYYTLEICGLKRKLPLIPISPKTKIASFNILGDTELTEKVAQALATKLKKIKFDYLVGPEVKVVPLIHELSRKLKHKIYVICRKSVKPYMISPTILKPLSYFPKHVRPLVIDGVDKEMLTGKKVVIVDDVVSTGVTIRMIKKLMEKIGAETVATVAVIRQGKKQFDSIENFVYLAELPIFKS